MNCKNCNSQINDGEKYCPNCGCENELALICPICKTPFGAGQKKCKKCLTPLPKTERMVPDEVKKFNFSAMFLSFFWGLTHQVYSPLVVLIPVVGVVVFPFLSIYLGFKGNEIAWKKGSWKNTEEFFEDNKIWNIVAWSVFAACTVAIIAILAIMIVTNKPYIEKTNAFFKIYNTDFKKEEILSSIQIETNSEVSTKFYDGLVSLKKHIGETTKYRFDNSKWESKNGVVKYRACYITTYKNIPNKDFETCIDMLGKKLDKNTISIVGFHVKEK